MTADDSLEGIRVWQVGRLAVRPVHHVDVRLGQLHSPCGTARWHICEGTVHRRRGRLSHRHDRPWRSYGDPPGGRRPKADSRQRCVCSEHLQHFRSVLLPVDAGTYRQAPGRGRWIPLRSLRAVSRRRLWDHRQRISAGRHLSSRTSITAGSLIGFVGA